MNPLIVSPILRKGDRVRRKSGAASEISVSARKVLWGLLALALSLMGSASVQASKESRFWDGDPEGLPLRGAQRDLEWDQDPSPSTSSLGSRPLMPKAPSARLVPRKMRNLGDYCEWLALMELRQHLQKSSRWTRAWILQGVKWSLGSKRNRSPEAGTAGEIDLMVYDAVSKKIHAVFEVKCNPNELGHAETQLRTLREAVLSGRESGSQFASLGSKGADSFRRVSVENPFQFHSIDFAVPVAPFFGDLGEQMGRVWSELGVSAFHSRTQYFPASFDPRKPSALCKPVWIIPRDPKQDLRRLALGDRLD